MYFTGNVLLKNYLVKSVSKAYSELSHVNSEHPRNLMKRIYLFDLYMPVTFHAIKTKIWFPFFQILKREMILI